MLGERLFPLIQRMYPDMAGKITGMLLEIDNSELLHMLEHNESLKPRLMKLLLCCRLTRPSKWLQQLLQPSRRRNRARILNLKKKWKKKAKQEKRKKTKPNVFFFF